MELIVQPDAHDVVGEMGVRGEGPRKRCGRRLAQPGQKFSEQRKSDCRQRGSPQRDNNGQAAEYYSNNLGELGHHR